MNCIESHPSKPLDHCRSLFYHHPPISTLFLFILGRICATSRHEAISSGLGGVHPCQDVRDGPIQIDQVLTSSRISGSTLFCSEVRRSTTSAQCPESNRSSSWTNRSTQARECEWIQDAVAVKLDYELTKGFQKSKFHSTFFPKSKQPPTFYRVYRTPS